MKKKLWYLLMAAGVLAVYVLPTPGRDAQMIKPVEVVCLSRGQQGVEIVTDTGAAGEGKTLRAALEDLHEQASEEIFLETADYLLVEEDCDDLLPEVMEVLRPSCVVCRYEGEPKMEQVGRFLRQHRPTLTLARYQAGERSLSLLKTDGRRMRLVS